MGKMRAYAQRRHSTVDQVARGFVVDAMRTAKCRGQVDARLTADDLATFVELLRSGHSRREAATSIGTTWPTLKAFEERDPEFARRVTGAIENARTQRAGRFVLQGIGRRIEVDLAKWRHAHGPTTIGTEAAAVVEHALGQALSVVSSAVDALERGALGGEKVGATC